MNCINISNSAIFFLFASQRYHITNGTWPLLEEARFQIVVKFYCTETSSKRNDVGKVMSLVPRN